MAITARKQLLKTVVVMATAIFLVILATPVWGMGRAARADAASDAVTGILIGWDEGKMGLESLASTVSGDGRNGATPNDDSGMVGLLGGFPGAMSALEGGEWLAPEIQAVTLPEGMPAAEAMELISRLPGVRYVEPDTAVSVDACSQDPYYSKQWFMPHIGAERAWDAERGSGSLVVAVVDTGVDASHPDLAGRVLKGYDFVGKDYDPSDVHGHGTHVAGIAAASGENGVGVAGLAWRASILPVKVLDDHGSGSYSDVIAGIRYAADSGAAVINLSLGGSANSRALQEAVDYARSKGVIVVAAAGNGGLDSLSYPAACEGVIAVGATDDLDRRTSFSNRGKGLDLVAPGSSIYSDIPDGKYGYKSGTSMSAPQVSGAFALLLSREPGLTAAEAEQRMLSSARDLGPAGYDPEYGWGLLRLDKAMGLEDEVPDGDRNVDGDRYFAEGYTGEGFDTYILLENPDSKGSKARLELFGTSGLSATVDVDVAPRARLTLRLNDLAPPGDVAARISLPEGSRIVAQRSMYFDYNGIRGGHTSRACPASNTWYFAEGYTGPGYETYLLVFNPQREAARVDIGLLTSGGLEHKTIELSPQSRVTLKLNDILPGVEVATVLSADRPVVAERAMYFNVDGRDDGSVAAGATSPAEQWYFAEGYTGEGFDEWLLLANPSDREVAVTAEFQRSDGVMVEHLLTLRPYSRATIHVDEIPCLEEAMVSSIVKASSPGVVAERSMYFTYEGSMGTVTGGHAAGGATSPSSQWLVPEGYTGPGFESWVLISNLEDTAVTVGVDIYGESGSRVHRDYLVEAHSRFSVKENDLLVGQGVSAEISAPEGTRLVVEGSFYFRYGGDIDGGSV